MEKIELAIPCKVGEKVKCKLRSWHDEYTECEVIRYEIQKFGKVKVVLQYKEEPRHYGNQIVINIRTATLELSEFCKMLEEIK